MWDQALGAGQRTGSERPGSPLRPRLYCLVPYQEEEPDDFRKCQGNTEQEEMTT